MEILEGINALTIDKENTEVCYNDELHKYWRKDGGGQCISVTTLIHLFTTFDEPFWARYKALQRLATEDVFDGPLISKTSKTIKRGPPSEAKSALLDSKIFDHKWSEFFGFSESEVEEVAEEILAEWAEKREESCIRGSAYHKARELEHLNGNSKELKELNLSGSFSPKIDNIIEPGQFVYPELLLSRVSPDGKLRIAGQADLVIVDGWDVYILDYKTSKTIEKNAYYDRIKKKSSNMLYPLNGLPDTNFWHYSLQLSTYAWMIQKVDPRFNIKKLTLIHYDHDSNTTLYECDYLKREVEAMLSFYKKKIENDEFHESRKKHF